MLVAGGLDRGGRGPLPAGPLPQPTGADRAGARRGARRRDRPPGAHRLRRLRHRRCARPLRRRPAEHHPPARRPLLRAVRRRRRVRRPARCRAGNVLLDGLPGQALRSARVAGTRSRSAPRAARRVLRELPAGRAAVAVRGSPAIVEAGRAAAEQLGLDFEHRHVGRRGLADAVGVVVSRRVA